MAAGEENLLTRLASPKIKKKSVSGKASAARRQGAIPCLILIFIVLLVVAVLFFASFAHGATLGIAASGPALGTRTYDRHDPTGALTSQLRPTRLTPDYLMTAEGSVLIEAGNTRVLCAATVEDTVPPFLRNTGKGWITAEYSMLPRATVTRTPREVNKGKPSGRTHEIQRLIGRSLRSVVDLATLGERSIIVDCDVLQADGGTRTAAITGAYVALAIALRTLVRYKAIPEAAVARFRGRHQRRNRRRRSHARFELRRGFPSGSGHERSDDRVRQVRRTASHCRTDSV